jgi:hypothetical protein
VKKTCRFAAKKGEIFAASPPEKEYCLNYDFNLIFLIAMIGCVPNFALQITP